MFFIEFVTKKFNVPTKIKILLNFFFHCNLQIRSFKIKIFWDLSLLIDQGIENLNCLTTFDLFLIMYILKITQIFL